MGLGVSKSKDTVPPPRSVAASASPQGGGTGNGRTAQEIVAGKIKKKWPHPGQIQNEAHLQELVTDYMAPATLFEQHFSHIENPVAIEGKFTEAQINALKIYQAQCAGMLPVKLVMSALPIASSNWARLANIAARTMMEAKYGLSHLDLLVGDRLVGWFDDSLVGIKSMDSKGALRRVVAVFDLHPNIRCAESRPFLLKLCQGIAQWNTDFGYDKNYGKLASVKERNAANCQGFVAWMIDFLGLSNQYLEGVIGGFMTNFINNPGSWWQSVALRGNRIPLSSHEAFDHWVIREYKGKVWDGEDYDFLKGIDRGFWMRYKAQQVFIAEESGKGSSGDAKKLELARAELARVTCCKSEDGHSKRCPFGNPLPYEERIPEIVDFSDVKFTISPEVAAASAAVAAAVTAPAVSPGGTPAPAAASATSPHAASVVILDYEPALPPAALDDGTPELPSPPSRLTASRGPAPTSSAPVIFGGSTASALPIPPPTH